MIPILSQLFCDNDSLFEYERNWGTDAIVNIANVKRRLVALERQNAPLKHDTYYEGIAKNVLDPYNDMSDIMEGIPYKLAKDCLTSVNDEVYVKAEAFAEWTELIRQFPPLLMIAAFFMDCFTASMLTDRKRIIEFVNNNLSRFRHTTLLAPYIPAFEFLMDKENGLNDLHIHLNGTTETDVLWNQILYNPLPYVKNFQNVFECNATVRKQSEQIISDFTPEMLYKRLTMAGELRGKMIAQIGISNGIITDDKIITEKRRFSFPIKLRNLWGDWDEGNEFNSLIDELLFCLCVMSEMRLYHDTRIANMFHHYMLIKGLVHRFVVMQRLQVGFPQFQLLTENSFRWKAEEYYGKRFMQLVGCNSSSRLSLIEGRFSPRNTSMDNHRLINKIIRGFEEAKKESSALHNTQICLIAHFIKRPETKSEKQLAIRYRLLRKDLKRKAVALALYLKKTSNNNYVVGIDAAASEFDAGPEVFAQTYRFMRSFGMKHFTFHAGEDFSHLISGLRTIIEAVRFLDLRSGDRLGHCTAVGISPQLWTQRIGAACYMPQGEWLDDLVFVWMLIRESKHERLQHLVLPLESVISEFSYKIYGEDIPPYLLTEAWEYRRYDPFFILESEETYCDIWYSNYNEDDFRDIKKKFCGKDKKLLKIMIAYHEPADSIAGNGRSNYEKVIRVEIDELFDIQSLEILQQLVLSELTRKEIVVEALPTSNMCISYYQHLNEYHLKRWLELDDNGLLPPVVLGSDDPGIFMTNIYNEYALAYTHLDQCNCSAARKMEKLMVLHKNSNIYKFNKDD